MDHMLSKSEALSSNPSPTKTSPKNEKQSLNLAFKAWKVWPGGPWRVCVTGRPNQLLDL
jgi:hypothetical protein